MQLQPLGALLNTWPYGYCVIHCNPCSYGAMCGCVQDTSLPLATTTPFSAAAVFSNSLGTSSMATLQRCVHLCTLALLVFSGQARIIGPGGACGLEGEVCCSDGVNPDVCPDFTTDGGRRVVLFCDSGLCKIVDSEASAAAGSVASSRSVQVTNRSPPTVATVNATKQVAPTLARVNVTAANATEKPWDVAVTPEGNLLFSEVCRGLSIAPRADDAWNDTILLFGNSTLNPSLNASDFFCEGQSGALGVEVDPDFELNRFVYLFMASNDGGGGRSKSNHIVRLTLAEDGGSVFNRTDIIDDIYFKMEDTDNGDAGAHSGGRIRFGPDGYLYVTTGDNHNATLPQDLNALGGKVLRVTRDGEPPEEGNNMTAGADPRIFVYGCRNVQVRMLLKAFCSVATW